MPRKYISTIVFVGKGENVFPGSVIGEQTLHNEFGPLDTDQLKTGPFSQFRYAQGRYEVLVVPDRVILRSNKDQEVLPPVLIDAARKVIVELEPMRKAIPVVAMGINCEATFTAQEIGREGRELCKTMLDTPIATHILQGKSLHMALGSFICLSPHVQYTIRVEPEHATQGRDLFVNVNGHQTVQDQDSLSEKLEAAEEVKEQITTLHQQINSL